MTSSQQQQTPPLPYRCCPSSQKEPGEAATATEEASTEKRRRQRRVFATALALLLVVAAETFDVLGTYRRPVTTTTATATTTTTTTTTYNDGFGDDESPIIRMPPTMTLLPLQIIDQYKQWHSQQSLLQDHSNNDTSNIDSRKFVVAYWQCPHGAGNRVHEFVNSLILSVISNRTMLWRYWDPTACREYPFDDHVDVQLKNCDEQNRFEDCQGQFLNLLPWLPSWDEWSAKLDSLKQRNGDDNIDATTLEYYSVDKRVGMDDAITMPTTNSSNNSNDDDDNNSDDDNNNTLWPNQTVIHFYRRVWALDWTFTGQHDGEGVDFWYTRNQTWPTRFSRSTAAGLYDLGKLFLYGAAFHALFEFADPIVRAAAAAAAADDAIIETTGTPGSSSSSPLASSSSPLSSATAATASSVGRRRDANNDVTIAVHSRHPYDEIDGCDVGQELDCIGQLLNSSSLASSSGATTAGGTCRVWVMSDRQCTLDRLQESRIVSSTFGGAPCTVHVVNHNGTAAAFEPRSDQQHFAEHGPFAGAGYFVELLRVSSDARDGAVVSLTPRNGFTRSSSTLLLELIEYNRKMEAARASAGRTTTRGPKAVQDLPQCKYMPLNPDTATKNKMSMKLGVQNDHHH